MEKICFDCTKEFIVEREVYQNTENTTSVFEARDKSLDRSIILKSIKYTSKNELESIKREIKNQIVLSEYSDYVPLILNAFVDNKEQKLWIEMSKIKGKSLREIIEEQENVKKDEFWYKNQYSLFSDICRSVSYIHNLTGFVHKDLKPENIIVNRKRKSVYIIDFGISGPGISKGIGTEKYMAPEQRNMVDKYHVTQATDVYALGQIAVELFCGYTLKYGKDLVFNPLGNTWLKEPEYGELDLGQNKNIRDVIKKCLAMAPENRYQNAGEIVKALSKNTSHENKNYNSKKQVIQYKK